MLKKTIAYNNKINILFDSCDECHLSARCSWLSCAHWDANVFRFVVGRPDSLILFIYLFIAYFSRSLCISHSRRADDSWDDTDWTIRRQARGDNSVALWVGTGDPQDLSASGAGQCHRLCRVLPPSARHLVTPVRATDLRSQTSWTRDGGDDLHFFFQQKSGQNIIFGIWFVAIVQTNR